MAGGGIGACEYIIGEGTCEGNGPGEGTRCAAVGHPAGEGTCEGNSPGEGTRCAAAGHPAGGGGGGYNGGVSDGVGGALRPPKLPRPP